MYKKFDRIVIESKSDKLEKKLRKLVTELIPEYNYSKTRKEEVEKVIQIFKTRLKPCT